MMDDNYIVVVHPDTAYTLQNERLPWWWSVTSLLFYLFHPRRALQAWKHRNMTYEIGTTLGVRIITSERKG